MKIRVNLAVSQNTDYETYDLEDFDLTIAEWESMSDYEKSDIIQKAVNNLPEQPYWVVDSFSEI